MITHLQEENTEQSYIQFHYILKIFYVDKFLVGILIANSQKLIELIYRKVEGYSRPESLMNQFNIIKIYTIFTQEQDTNFIQVTIDYKLGDTGLYPGT